MSCYAKQPMWSRDSVPVEYSVSCGENLCVLSPAVRLRFWFSLVLQHDEVAQNRTRFVKIVARWLPKGYI